MVEPGDRGGPADGRTGVEFSPDSVLLREALSILDRGPVTTMDLAQRVLGLRGGPPAIADRLVSELLRGESRVGKGEDGLWRVAEPSARSSAVHEQPLDEVSYAVVDVETNGGIAGRGGRIIEIAIVHVDGGALGSSWSTLVDAGVSISPWIARLTGIRTEMIRGAPRFSEISEDVRARLRGRVFVAHNVGFDWGFVRAELGQAGAVVPRGPRLCTVHFARRLLPGLARRGLDSLAAYYGVEIHGRHRAQGDAVATAQVLVRMLADAQRRGWTTWEELQGGLGPIPKKRKKRRLERASDADR